MEHVAVLVRSPAPVLRDVRRDQPEYSQPLETERTSRSTARQEGFAVNAGVRRLVPQRGDLVHDWVDAEGLDTRPCQGWVQQRGMRLSYKKPAKCVKELHSPEQQHANTHPLFIKLWLVDKHAVSADCVVNIDETSCPFLPVHHIAWGRHGVSCRATQRRPRHSQSPSAWTAARWTCTPSSRHVRERLGHHDHDPAARGHIGRRDEPKQRRAVVATPARPPWPRRQHGWACPQSPCLLQCGPRRMLGCAHY